MADNFVKEDKIIEYIRSVAALEEAIRPFREQKAELRKSFVENGWLTKEEIKLALKAYKLLKDETDMDKLVEMVGVSGGDRVMRKANEDLRGLADREAFSYTPDKQKRKSIKSSVIRIDEYIEAADSNLEWNEDPYVRGYMLGMAYGLALAKAILTNTEHKLIPPMEEINGDNNEVPTSE